MSRFTQEVALALQRENYALWTSAIAPHLTDDVLVDKIDASVEYGVRLYSIIHPAWRIMAQGALHQRSDAAFNKTEVRSPPLYQYPDRMIARMTAFPCILRVQVPLDGHFCAVHCCGRHVDKCLTHITSDGHLSRACCGGRLS